MSITVSLLPNARQQFIDADGNPLIAGTVGTYIPGTLTAQDTWQDVNGTILNSNPLTLDDLGSAAIWGTGNYRQIVKDSFGNVVWDDITGTFPAGTFQALGEIILTWTGTQPNADIWLGGESIAIQQIVLATAPGSSGVTPKTLPTATYTVTIKKNGTTVGTAVMTSGGGAWVYTWVAQTTFAAGDVIDFYGSGDITTADFGLTIKTEIA